MATIPGSTGDDTLIGTIEDDLMTGLAGNDIFVSSDGADAMEGGDDFDMALYEVSTAAVTVNLATGIGSGGQAEGDTYVSIEDVVGSDFNDMITGSDVDNFLNGGDGNDTLAGGLSGDTLFGGAGIDTADYSASDAAITIDLLNGTALGGHAAGDLLDLIENVTGSGFDDVLFGDTGSNRLDGGAGNDTLVGDAGADALVGGSGVDLAAYSLSASVIINLASGTGQLGEAQGDTFNGIENLDGSIFADSLTGNGSDNLFNGDAGNDTLRGGAGNDTLNGDEGDDWVDGGTGNDVLDGGTGINTLDYNASATSVKVNLTTGLTFGGFGVDTLSNFQHIIGSEFGDSLTGDAQNNILVGSTGADTLTGNGGIDTADYTSSIGDVRVSLLSGTGLRNAALGDVLAGIENLTGSAFNDSLTGDTGTNVLAGLDGDDSLLGGDGADTLIGGTGNDSLTGGNGDDTFYVDSTTDKISEGSTGGTGDLVYASADYTLSLYVEDLVMTGTGNLNGTGNSGANDITGNAGHNSLSGGSGNDALTAGDGNDTLNGGGGTDAMAGDDGDDAYFVDNVLDTATEAANNGTDTINSTVAWTLHDNFENLTLIGSTGVAGTGNALDNDINGNIGSNLLTGLGGDDSIVGDFTDSTLSGGNDTLDGGAGDNTLVGGLGNDTYLVTTGNDTIVENAEAGTDVVISDVSHSLADNVENLILSGIDSLIGTGNDLNNVITGNDGNNQLAGDTGADTLNGGIGDDTLEGGAGIDSLVGGVGDDDYFVDDAADKTIEGAGAGNDQVYSTVSYTLASNLEELHALGTGAIDLTGNTLNNLISGNSAANALSGSTGDDTLNGGDGNDSLTGGSGTDSMSGNDGDDTYTVDAALDLTIEAADEGTDTVRSSLNWTLADNIEALILTGSTGLSGTGNDLANTITGTTGANALNGAAGADTLNGDAGNDSLNGGAGNDSLVGGLGDDTYTLSTLDDVVVEGVGEGIDTVRVDVSYTLGDNVDKLVLTGPDDIDGTGNVLNNVLTGNGGVNALSGLAGDDTLVGGVGADTLNGGEGADSMSGGTGADTYNVDDAGDKVIETSAPQIDTVISTVSFTLGSYVENLELVSGAIDATGNSIANSLTGTAGVNVLLGLGGNDTLTGLAGADTLDGGIGNDTMIGGNGNDVYKVNSLSDVVDEAGTTGIDRVESAVNYILGTDLENLTLTGANRVNATGNAGNNVIIGNGNNNKLTGLEGDDDLTGGLGADTFIFTGANNGLDTITDFNGLVSGVAEGDKLQFADASLVGTFAYVGASGFTGGSDNSEARVNTTTGRVIIDLDGDGAGDITIALTGLTSEDQLVVTDFTFV